MPKNIKKEDIEIIKTLQNNNPNIMNDLEDVYKIMYIEKTVPITVILNDSNQKAFAELIKIAHYMNFKNKI